MKILHFQVTLPNGYVTHSFYTSLSALIIAEQEHLTISKSSLEKWHWKAKTGEKLTHGNWVLSKSIAITKPMAEKEIEAAEHFANHFEQE